MKVYIGPYLQWWGPYQIAGLLKYVGVSENKRQKIGDKLVKTRLNDICQWCYDKRKRTVKIKLHDYDAWNADATLSLVTLPLLKKIRESKQGAPNVDDADVPDYLRSINAPPKENEYDTDLYWFKRWDWIVSEMIWTFEQLQPDCDWESKYYNTPPVVDGDKIASWENTVFDKVGYEQHSKRISNGLRLFGKYYQGLWT